MKILFVSSGNANDGLGSIVKNQGQSLIEQGVDVDYFLIKGKGLISYFKHIFKLRVYLKNQKYEIIHAHYGFCGIVACFAKRNEKIVTSFMGSDLLGPVDQYGKTSISSFFITQLNKIFAKHFFDYTIVKSQNLKDKLFQKTVSQTIPNGVDLSRFFPIEKAKARQELNLDLNKKIILFATNPNRPEKNYSLALDAFKLLNDSNVTLKVVYNENQEVLNKYYNAADVVLLTSFYEGSPNAVKEAMACNSVIVSTDVGDVKQNTLNIEGCFICSFDPNDVAAKINCALKFEKSKSREIIYNFDSKSIAAKIIAIYKQLLSH